METKARSALLGPVAAMCLLAVALGYVEAAVVVYLRQCLAPARRRRFPDRAREPLPLHTLDQLRQDDPELPALLKTELVREVAAIAVLVAAAWGLRRRRGQFLALFMMGFALWDIFYYVSLKAVLDWPASLATWDILFLIPVPWVAPVWAPLAVSATLLVASSLALLRSRRPAARARMSLGALAALVAGAALILASFFTRSRQALGVVPAEFDWPWFAAGWLLGTVGLALWLRPARRKP